MKRIVAVAVLSLAGSTWAANLLVNPGFETGTLAGWTVTGAEHGVGIADAAIPSAYYESTVAVQSGAYAAFGVVRGACCTVPEPVTFSQTVDVAPGTDYAVGFSLNNHSGTTVGYATGNAPSQLQIVVNGVGLLPSTALCPGGCLDPARGWFSFTGMVNSGAATSLTVDFRIVASGTGSIGLSADDFYVTGAPVPEPGTMALTALALGALALRLRRRTA